MNDVLGLLNAHRSIRAYKKIPVSQGTVEAIVQAGQAAATSSFIQAYSVIQVAQGEPRNQLAALAANQTFIAEAPVFLVVCADMQRHKMACDMNGADMLSGYAEQFITSVVDSSLLAQNMVVAAESMGLGICYVGALRNNIAEVSDLLGLPDLVVPLFGLCIGYPSEKPDIKPRLPVKAVLRQERYDDPEALATLQAYDELTREYYQTRTGGQKSQSWTEQMAAKLAKESRPHILAFMQSKGFLLK